MPLILYGIFDMGYGIMSMNFNLGFSLTCANSSVSGHAIFSDALQFLRCCDVLFKDGKEAYPNNMLRIIGP